MLSLALAAPVTAAAVPDPGVEDLLGRIDARWRQRDAHGAVPDMVALATVVLAIDPQSYEGQWRMARAYFWVAYTQPNRLVKKALAARAIDWAARARRTRPDRVEGHYLYGIAVGEYASTVGLLTAVRDGVAKKVEASVGRAYEIDPDYLYGAPGTVLGRYYALLPWPLRDLERSRRYLEEVVARHPDSLIARYYLAETYRELDEDEQARAQLEYVLRSEPAPGTELERPAPKPLARQAMREWFN